MLFLALVVRGIVVLVFSLDGVYTALRLEKFESLHLFV